MTSEPAWRTTLLSLEASIQQAIASLDTSSMKIVLVAGADDHLIGTVTDGDIRRGLLRGVDLASGIDSIVHRKPLVVPPDLSRELVLGLMRANKFQQLPVVDETGRVVGLHLWDDLLTPSARPNRVVIMAGGRGVRLHPHTEDCPKPMLPVGGKPMLEHIIERAKAEGFRRFSLSLHYLGHMIEDYFGDGRRWDVEIDYLRETEPLGTGGSLSLLPGLPAETLLVTNGDVLTDIRYGELLDFHVRHAAGATMAVRLHEWQHPFGVVRTKGMEIIGFEEKPVSRSHINAGIYALEPDTLGLLNRNEHCDMPTLFARAGANAVLTIAYPMHEPWLDVGRHADLALARDTFPVGDSAAPVDKGTS